MKNTTTVNHEQTDLVYLLRSIKYGDSEKSLSLNIAAINSDQADLAYLLKVTIHGGSEPIFVDGLKVNRERKTSPICCDVTIKRRSLAYMSVIVLAWPADRYTINISVSKVYNIIFPDVFW